jgi:hypothetical protein
MRWLTLELELVDDAHVEQLRQRLDSLDRRSQTLLNPATMCCPMGRARRFLHHLGSRRH